MKTIGLRRTLVFKYSWILFFFLFNGLSMAADNTYESTQVSVAELTKWAKKMQIVFPKNTRPLGIRQVTGLDDVVFLKVECNYLPCLCQAIIYRTIADELSSATISLAQLKLK